MMLCLVDKVEVDQTFMEYNIRPSQKGQCLETVADRRVNHHHRMHADQVHANKERHGNQEGTLEAETLQVKAMTKELVVVEEEAAAEVVVVEGAEVVVVAKG